MGRSAENDCLALVQARMGSSRLPGKVLMDIEGRPALWQMVNRLRHSRLLTDIVIATSTAAGDDPLAAFAEQLGLDCFRGSENDVLDRFYRAAAGRAPRAVVRVTADCPLLDPAIVDRVLAIYLQGDYDYVSNCLPPTFPDGLDVEVMSMAALERCWREARTRPEREHVTPYMRTRPDRFRRANLGQAKDMSGLCWALDSAADLAFLRAIYAHIQPHERSHLSLAWVLRLLADHPELGRLNPDSVRDAKLRAEVPGILDAAANAARQHLWEAAA